VKLIRSFSCELRRSIAFRLATAFAVTAASVFLVLGWYLANQADAHLAEMDANELRTRIRLVQHMAQHSSNGEELRERLTDALVGSHGVHLVIDEADGTRHLWESQGITEILAVIAVPSSDEAVVWQYGDRNLRAVGTSLPVPWGSHIRAVAVQDVRQHADFSSLQHGFWLAVVLAAAVTALLGMAITAWGLFPVRMVAEVASSVCAGRLDERIDEAHAPVELRALVHSFNDMLARLEDSFQRLSEFSADLAHELRSPVHALRIQTEVSLTRARSTADYESLLASNLEVYEQLSRTIADMLFLAKAERGLATLEMGPVNLQELCRKLTEFYAVLTEGAALSLEGGDNVFVLGDASMLQRAVGNLVANAVRHVRPGGRIWLRVTKTEAGAAIEVGNDGTTIPESELSRIFDRFVRLDERSSDDHSGLGLAITQSIVRAHHGRIAVFSAEGVTRFVVTLSDAGP
jgi:two-component system heavy metal sensor histidine kinase CusS